MNIGLWNYYEIENELFSNNETNSLGEHVLLPFYRVYEKAKKIGINIEVINSNKNINYYDLFIFNNFPNLKINQVNKAINSNKPKFLIMHECESIHPNNYKTENLKIFDKCFTWNDDYIDNKKFFKINCPSYENFNVQSQEISFNNKSKLSCMISSNKINDHENDLYKERLKIIKWFEENYSNDFDLFGFYWDKKIFNNKYLNKLNSIIPFAKNNFNVYKGTIDEKINTLPNYKFSFCLENASNYKGYITEKIFHCFFYNTVPIYQGPANINDYIPKETYIDYNSFDSLYKLYDYINNVDENQYNQYLNEAKNFLNKLHNSTFSIKYYCSLLINQIHYYNTLKK